jgi:DNA-binding NarL/FixJ family response regulator
MSRPIKIAIVDDHTLFREGVRRVLESEHDIEVCGEAGCGPDAILLVAATAPDVVLLDVEMPGDGVSATVRRLKEISPGTAVIILSMYDESALVRSLIDQGISGYLLKSVTSGELLAAIRSSRTGGRLILAVSARSTVGDRDGHLLSRREREILELAAQALSNSQIATRLFVAEATVKRHMHNAFRKLGAVSRIDAVNKAKAAAIISTSQSYR